MAKSYSRHEIVYLWEDMYQVYGVDKDGSRTPIDILEDPEAFTTYPNTTVGEP